MSMQHPTAFCRVHGFFPAQAFALGPGSSVTITGCSTDCPACGAKSEIIPGNYQALSDCINLLLDASISPQALGALRKIAELAEAQKISAEQAKHEAERVVPGGGRLFDVSNWSDQARATLYASIIGAIAVVAAAKLSSCSSPNVVVHPTIERIIERPIHIPSIANMPKYKEKPRRKLMPPASQPQRKAKRKDR
jgi:hypothetical protein